MNFRKSKSSKITNQNSIELVELIELGRKGMSGYEQIAEYLKQKTRYRPEIGIICGSGLSGLSKTLHNTETFHYSEIPGFPQATVPGHAGELVFGLLGNIECVCMKGRFHYYEGNDMLKVVLPIRVMRLLGVKLLIVTNAAGGLNSNFSVGDIVVIQDHFGLPCMAGLTPLRGVNDDALGPRFPSMSDAYDKKLQEFVLNAAEKLSIRDRIRPNGTYCFLSGPTYETPTECRFLKLLGGDTVGMSTVPEIIAAKHCGMKILGLSLVTNIVVMDKNSDAVPASHAEVLEAVDASGRYVEAIVTEIAKKEILGDYLQSLPNFTYVPKLLVDAQAETKEKEAKEREAEKARIVSETRVNDLFTFSIVALTLGAFIYFKQH